MSASVNFWNYIFQVCVSLQGPTSQLHLNPGPGKPSVRRQEHNRFRAVGQSATLTTDVSTLHRNSKSKIYARVFFDTCRQIVSVPIDCARHVLPWSIGKTSFDSDFKIQWGSEHRTSLVFKESETGLNKIWMTEYFWQYNQINRTPVDRIYLPRISIVQSPNMYSNFWMLFEYQTKFLPSSLLQVHSMFNLFLSSLKKYLLLNSHIQPL